MRKNLLKIRGFTLVEVVISMSIMLIIMIITGSMLISGLNVLYYDAESLQVKNIGDAVCETISDSFMYSADTENSDEISIYDGKLYIKYADEEVSADVYGDEFYNGYSVGYTADVNDKYAVVTVDVYDEYGESVYTTKKSVIRLDKKQAEPV